MSVVFSAHHSLRCAPCFVLCMSFLLVVIAKLFFTLLTSPHLRTDGWLLHFQGCVVSRKAAAAARTAKVYRYRRPSRLRPPRSTAHAAVACVRRRPLLKAFHGCTVSPAAAAGLHRAPGAAAAFVLWRMQLPPPSSRHVARCVGAGARTCCLPTAAAATHEFAPGRLPHFLVGAYGRRKWAVRKPPHLCSWAGAVEAHGNVGRPPPLCLGGGGSRRARQGEAAAHGNARRRPQLCSWRPPPPLTAMLGGRRTCVLGGGRRRGPQQRWAAATLVLWRGRPPPRTETCGGDRRTCALAAAAVAAHGKARLPRKLCSWLRRRPRTVTLGGRLTCVIGGGCRRGARQRWAAAALVLWRGRLPHLYFGGGGRRRARKCARVAAALGLWWRRPSPRTTTLGARRTSVLDGRHRQGAQQRAGAAATFVVWRERPPPRPATCRGGRRTCASAAAAVSADGNVGRIPHLCSWRRPSPRTATLGGRRTCVLGGDRRRGARQRWAVAALAFFGGGRRRARQRWAAAALVFFAAAAAKAHGNARGRPPSLCFGGGGRRRARQRAGGAAALEFWRRQPRQLTNAPDTALFRSPPPRSRGP